MIFKHLCYEMLILMRYGNGLCETMESLLKNPYQIKSREKFEDAMRRLEMHQKDCIEAELRFSQLSGMEMPD